jgi:hypothetical protein
VKRPGRDEDEIATILLLGCLISAACVAGIMPMVDSLALTLNSVRATETARTDHICTVCGIVENVQELDPAVSRQEFSTVAGGGIEGIAVILGALGGNIRLDPVKIHEVAVRMQDGSVRLLRTATSPTCKPGDRVRVVMGRIVPA